MLNGKEIKPRNIPNAKRIRKTPEKIYSICTEERIPIIINGLDVMSWGYNEWLEKSNKCGISWINNNPKTEYSNVSN